MLDQPIENLFRCQTLVTVDRDERAADRKRVTDVAFGTRDARRQFYGVHVVRHGNVEAVFTAADEQIALHIDSPPGKSKLGDDPAFVFSI
jgi:hypothetical protein